MVIEHAVPVGATPKSQYASWAEHRAAIHRDSVDARRAHRAARRRTRGATPVAA